MEDLKDEYKQAKSPEAFVELAWNSSSKNIIARGYITGVIDTLRFASLISKAKYNELIAKFDC